MAPENKDNSRKKSSPDATETGRPSPDDTTVSSSRMPMLGDSVGSLSLEDKTTDLGAEGLEFALYARDPGDAQEMNNEYSRYKSHAVLGAGGVGAVASCFDPNLSRYVALKKLHPHLQEKHAEKTRFLREARVMAQLEHPHIVPVHEMGASEDGTPYFTMKKVRGNSLADILAELRAGNPEVERQYTLRNLLDIFRDVGQAVAFAHSRGIIHRDLKPGNILLGEFGEVLLVDWGLAKLVGSGGDVEEVPAMADLDRSILDSVNGEDVTLEGIVSGTPAYMAPEQALGKVSELSGQTDVYGLGTILYEILTLQRMIHGSTVKEALHDVVHGVVTPPRKRAPDRRIPKDLDAICMKAVQKDPDERYPSVKKMLEDIFNYQNDLPVTARDYTVVSNAWKWCKRHRMISMTAAAAVAACLLTVCAILLSQESKYRALVEEADGHRARGNILYEQMRQVQARLSQVRMARTEKSKDELELELEEQLERLESANRNEFDIAQVLYIRASKQRPSKYVRNSLFEMLSLKIHYAILKHDYSEAQNHLDLIRTFTGKNFENASDEHRDWLLNYDEMARGMAVLKISLPEKVARAVLLSLSPNRRQIRRQPPIDLPLAGDVEMTLPKGSYVVRVESDSGYAAAFPILLEGFYKQNLTVALLDQVPAGMIYIPAGPFVRGGASSNEFRRHTAYLDSFCIKEKEVTFGEYLDFWQAEDGGAKAESLRARVRFNVNVMAFTNAWNDQGQLIASFSRDMPVVGISQAAATAYCQWLGRKLGTTVRLPTAGEWEKAARGVDGRVYPWGSMFEPDFCLTNENTAVKETFPLFAPVGSFPRDRSVYGVLDLAGNAREWTSSPYEQGSQFYQIKGSSSALTRRFAACAYSSNTPVVPTDVGFRYIMP